MLATLFGGALYAQDRRISGSVTSAGDGSPIPGVSVIVKDVQIGVQTDVEGNYSIAIPSGATALIFRSIGYAEQEVPIGSGDVINVRLSEDASVLTEVIVTGYGQELKKQSLTGSVSVLSGGEIENLPTQSFDRAMQGRLGGVQVTSNGGQPGGGLNVNIRGAVSVNGSAQPLYIIDGVQMNPGGLSTQTTQNLFSFINQEDIESIQVLKDAATASIYGAQAANGVVLVTTKKGKAGRTVIKVDIQQGFQENPNPYDLATGPEYYEIYRQAYYNQYLVVSGNGENGTRAWNNRLYGSPNNPDPASIPNINWYDAVFRKGNMGQYNISFSGGSEKTSFFIGGGYNKTEGTNIGSDFTRGNLRANLEHRASDKFSIETRINLHNTISRGPAHGNGFYTNTPFTGALLVPTLNPIYDEEGGWNNDLINGYGYNIVQVLHEEDRETNTYGTISTIALNYDIIPGLRVRAYGGVDFTDARNFNYRPSSIPAYAGTGGTGAENYYRTLNWNTSLTANYNTVFGADHNFSAMAGVEYRDYTQRVLSASAQGFPNTMLRLISQASTNTGYGSTFTGFKLASVIGNVNYDYQGKYLLSGNVRYDGSSRFGADNKFGLFYGLSGGWRLSEENFLSDVRFVNELKLRASYGVTGDQSGIGNFAAMTLFSSPGAGAAYNGQPTLRPDQIGIADLTWEEVESINLGLDFGLFRNRLFGSFDIYRNHRNQMLLSQQIPQDSGYGSITVNAGRARMEGIDLELGGVPVDAGGFKWTSSFNIALIDNKLLELNEDAALDRDGNPQINDGRYTVGKKLNQVYTIPWAGVNPADGRAMYYDINGNITYSPISADDRRAYGSYDPDFFGGWTNTFSYKGFSLDVLFQYQYGNMAWTDMNYPLELSGAYGYNQLKSQLYDAWSQPGDITGVPRPFYNGAEPGSVAITTFSSRWLQDASYIRLKQLTFGYSLPSSVLSGTGIQSVRLFAQGMNLWTITKYTGEDPENTATNNSMNVYPHPRTFTFGANITF